MLKDSRSVLFAKKRPLQQGGSRLRSQWALSCPGGHGDTHGLALRDRGCLALPSWSCCLVLRSQPLCPAPGNAPCSLPTPSTPAGPRLPSCQQRRQHVCLTFEGMIYKQPLMHLLTSFFHCLNFKFFGCKLLKSVQYALKGFARIWAELFPNGNTAPKNQHVSDFN